MIRRLRFAALALTLLLASCADPAPAPEPTSVPPTQTEPAPHAAEIRFALVGEPTDVNVWALFDEQGASYVNYALRSHYWPRLYHLAPPNFVFTPRAASGDPSPVIQEGDFFTSVVTLRSDLQWTDGSPFSAEDVGFTVNSALQFELGFDWKSFYPTDYLARAEAIDSNTVKFYFKQTPNVGAWQYGALQGPIVQREFWEPGVKSPATLLPDDTLRASIADAQARITKYQPIVNKLSAEVYTLLAQGKQDRALETELKRNQGNLDEANNDLSKALAEYAEKIAAAKQALYALDDKDEPTLGVWMPAGKEQGKWINEANLDFPFERPNFDRAVYTVFAEWASAIEAFRQNEADVFLNASGYSAFPPGDIPPSYPTSSARFLVFNPKRDVLADPALHQAIACVRDMNALFMDAKVLDAFVLSRPWQKNETLLICSGLSKGERIEHAVQILQAAGYSWVQKPTSEQAGNGLILPNGRAFPPVVLLTTMPEHDSLRSNAAIFMAPQIQHLGIPLATQETDPESVRYAVYSSGKYDMAILGWKLSAFPGYLCDWFQAPSPFAYNEDRLKSACEALDSTTDLELARQSVSEIESILREDLPFIPLYQVLSYEGYRNVTYPFDLVLDGLSGLYGAPSFAIPSP